MTTKYARRRRPEHNGRSREFHGLQYGSFRFKQVRTHNAVYHRFEEVPPLHIPVDLEGVIP